MHSKSIVYSCLLFFISFNAKTTAEPIYVVTSFSDYASIVKEIGGDLVIVDHLSHGDQDPHFVPPKPSLALKLKKADLFITTGLDLEVWATTLQDKARNKKIMDGAVGYVTVQPGIDLVQKPTTALSRSEGDIHIYGNPHIHTSPINWIQISENILIGLKKVDPENSAAYEEGQKAFVNKVHNAMFGDELVDLIGAEQLVELLNSGTLFDFLQSDFAGEKLIDKLGGWLKKGLPLRGLKVIAYHKNWAYFARDFGIEVVGYVERIPGIPPTPKHVEQCIRQIKDLDLHILLVASYFEKRKPTTIAQKTGITPVFLPLSVGGIEEATDNFTLIDYWIDSILAALK